jgi:hypothetical protein
LEFERVIAPAKKSHPFWPFLKIEVTPVAVSPFIEKDKECLLALASGRE